MKVGIYFTPRKEQGGVYQYSVQILESLARIPGNKYVILSTSPDVPKKFVASDKFRTIDVNSASRESFIKARDYFTSTFAIFVGFFIKLMYRFRLFSLVTPFYRYTQRSLIKIIESENFDIIFYPTSSDLSFLAEVPSVVTVHDLQHRLNSQFKEVSAGGRWEYREYGFIKIAQKAYRIFVDSKIGKKQMEEFYPEAKGRVVVLSYLPPDYISMKMSGAKLQKIKKKFKLPKNYIFYPSKFWPHKNHKSLIEALSILKQKGVDVNLVLTGSKDADFSSFSKIMEQAKKLNLLDNIFYLGYVDNDELSYLYKYSKALVMPTYFGPTNIPVLEAWKVGTPVIYSDIKGCREQLGNAGLLINPNDPNDIAKKISRIYTNPALAKKLVERGKIRVDKWTEKEFAREIEKVIEAYKKQNVKK